MAVTAFTKESDIIKSGTYLLRLQCLSALILGWVIISGMFLQNTGQFKKATIVSAARQGIFFIPLIILLPKCLGFLGLALTQPLSDIGTFLISMPWTIKGLKELKGHSEKISHVESL